MSTSEPVTPLEALELALRQAAHHNANDQVAPAAVLWTDEDRRWEPLVPALRARLPLLTLGAFDAAGRTGPAIWVRCALDETLGLDLPAGTPVVYLPGVARQELRAVDSCPPALQAVAELQYRGTWFGTGKGRDWSPAAFLRELDVSFREDRPTELALELALARVFDEPLVALRQQSPLSAGALTLLLNPDPIRQLLGWLDDPDGTRASLQQDAAAWGAFVATCKTQCGFDPVRDGPVTAAGLLGGREGAWANVWARFMEAPGLYRGIPDLLGKAKPAQVGLFDPSRDSWPQLNEQAEGGLRAALLALGGKSAPEARASVRELEAEHGRRRESVWGKLARAPLASALEPLVRLAEATETPLGAGSVTELAGRYAGGLWRTDDLALRSLAAAPEAADAPAVRATVGALYRPWLEAGAHAFQDAVEQSGLAWVPPEPAGPGVCLVFVDGLRLDLAHRLAGLLEGRGLRASVGWRLAPVPGVTATAKPLATPIAAGFAMGPELGVLQNDKAVTAQVLSSALEDGGIRVLAGHETGDPAGSGWTQCADIDGLGHDQGLRLAGRADHELRDVAERAFSLLAAGWQEVRVVTDHGWLLVPGGLPKVDLPLNLAVVRKGRCARLQPGASTDVPAVATTLDPSARIAVAPGIGAFVSGHEYEHGGLSVQECVIPTVTVVSSAPERPRATLDEVVWKGLRCRIRVSGAPAGATVVLRARAADASSSLAPGKPLSADGTASIPVDDSHEGTAALAVVLSASGEVLAQAPTVVGGA